MTSDKKWTGGEWLSLSHHKISETLSFFRSVILSGEEFSATCAEEFHLAKKANYELQANAKRLYEALEAAQLQIEVMKRTIHYDDCSEEDCEICHTVFGSPEIPLEDVENMIRAALAAARGEK